MPSLIKPQATFCAAPIKTRANKEATWTSIRFYPLCPALAMPLAARETKATCLSWATGPGSVGSSGHMIGFTPSIHGDFMVTWLVINGG